MVSKIIQKEKERQEEILSLDIDLSQMKINAVRMQEHKQGLINLKGYMEEELNYFNENVYEALEQDYKHYELSAFEQIESHYDQNEQGIEELKEMIKKYE